MARPVTLFTGQWADLPLETLAEKAASFGYDGLELACWGDHFEVDKALSDDGYVQSRWDILNKHGLKCFAISNHLVGQCVSDPIIDERHKSILPPRLWGDGNAEGVRQRAAQEIANTAQAAKLFGVKVVNGFTGSPIWHLIYRFPPTTDEMVDAGYREFADRWNPILDVFDEVGVRFALEAHPSEIAYDIYTAEKTLAALNNRPAFGFNFDPSHFIHQQFDPVEFIERFPDRIYHVHVKDSKAQSQRAQQHPRIAPQLWRFAAGLEFRLGRAWRRGFGVDHSRAEPHRLRRPALGRVGRQRHGSRTRRDRIRRFCAQDRFRALECGV